jgi:hypothetical protein
MACIERFFARGIPLSRSSYFERSSWALTPAVIEITHGNEEIPENPLIILTREVSR